MPFKFEVGDLVQIENLPKKSGSSLWPKREDGPFLGIIVDIVKSNTVFFKECYTIKVDSGEVVTLSPNLVMPVGEVNN